MNATTSFAPESKHSVWNWLATALMYLLVSVLVAVLWPIVAVWAGIWTRKADGQWILSSILFIVIGILVATADAYAIFQWVHLSALWQWSVLLPTIPHALGGLLCFWLIWQLIYGEDE